jgi:hypothetical protein
VLKFGIAAAWFTALASAEMFAPPDALDELAAELPAAAGVLDELDEQAASSSAAPAESAPSAIRAARGFRLLVLVLKRSMRPRIICIQGRPDHRI